jgi:general secretion pathway protein G
MKYLVQQGFTLLEMLVVLVIITLIAGLVGPRLIGHTESAKLKTANAQIQMLKGALGTLHLDIGRYPTDQEGLAILNAPPGDEKVKPFWKGPYLDGIVPLDPWNHPYQYSTQGSNGQPFALYSLGADGQPGGVDNNADIGFLPPR